MGKVKVSGVGRVARAAEVLVELERVPANSNKLVTDACESLRMEVVEGLKLNGNGVARFMVDQAIEGDLSALRLLVKLLEDPGGVPKKRVRRRSQAKRWAAEPEWQGEMEGGIWKDDGEDGEQGRRD